MFVRIFEEYQCQVHIRIYGYVSLLKVFVLHRIE